jgi:hypothetical protein
MHSSSKTKDLCFGTNLIGRDLHENICKLMNKDYYKSVGFAGRHLVGLVDLSINVVLEVQNKRCDQVLYLIGYIACGLQLW